MLSVIREVPAIYYQILDFDDANKMRTPEALFELHLRLGNGVGLVGPTRGPADTLLCSLTSLKAHSIL